MIVAELRAVLDHLPGDLPVIISVRGDRAARHVTEVARSTGPGRSRLVLRNDDRTEDASHLDPDPGFTLAGKFRRPDDLLVRLDPDTPLGEPAAGRRR